MKPVLSREQARAFDAHVIEQAKVPGLLLMENAGRGAADVIVSVLGRKVEGARVVVVCGTGNNGGDGFVIARHLLARAASVRAFRVGFVARLTGDARVNYDAYLGVGGSMSDLTSEADLAALRDALASADVVVDALFGTGLDRPIGGRTVDIVKRMSDVRGKRVAVDVPSGLDANTGATLGTCFVADVTVTFGHHKLGLLTPGGARVAGAVHLVDLGVPASLAPGEPAARLLERADVSRLLAPRGLDVHKHGAGHVAVLGGSEGKVGAPLMVARAALRTGAGLATVVSWGECQAALHARVLEEMSAAITRGDVAATVLAALGGKKALVVGPGLGTDEDASEVARTVLDAWKGPVVFDADALTMLAGSPEVFAEAKGRVVLTPHGGEAARLLGTTAAAVEADRYAAVRTLAARARAVVVLKGASTLIADPSGRIVVNSTGNPALATAGSGDTLGGMIGAFLCSLEPFDAACAAVFLHGMAADTWSARHGDRGLLASEIADGVPEAIAALTREHTRGPE